MATRCKISVEEVEMSSDRLKRLLKLHKRGYPVNSGVYSAVDEDIKMKLGEHGLYEPDLTTISSSDVAEKLLKVDLMSDESTNEDTLSLECFGQDPNIHHDPTIGYYVGLYTGYVKKGDYRKRGSSGGLTSWLLDTLLEKGAVDGVIHAQVCDPKTSDGVLFKYAISRGSKAVRRGAKSRYYPLEMSEALLEVKRVPGSYVVVGIPEFISEIRLLAKQDPVIKERIKYTVGLVCGHQKSARYSDALAWQHGIEPGDLREIDYRVKRVGYPADDYLHQLKGRVNGSDVVLTKNHSQLFAEDWGAGYFKAKFSDFTDNAFNELADVVFGDAWLPECRDDWMGTNIVIVRNTELANLIKDGIGNGELELNKVSVDKIIQSQEGLVRHIKKELPYRLWRQKIVGKWVPKKRVEPSRELPLSRRLIQNLRYKIARRSHVSFQNAIKKNSWDYFEQDMSRFMKRYKFAYRLDQWFDEGLVGSIRRKLKLRTRVINTLVLLKEKTRIRTRIKKAADKVLALQYRHADGAIITLSGFYNYGNMLQKYALQEFLRRNGYKFVVYNGVDTRHAMQGDVTSRFKHTSSFVKRHLWSKRFDTNDSYSTYITGSDQVWRDWVYPNGLQDFGYFFFNFDQQKSTRRIAYAASFGKDTLKGAGIDSQAKKYVAPLLNNIQAVSVREKSGIALLKKGWGLSAKQVVDPTLLLKEGDYSKLIEQSDAELNEVDDVFAFILATDKYKMNFVDDVAASLGGVTKILPYESEVLPPVEQWLKGFRDTKFVITDSFHGTIFSIINNTPFIVLENSNGGVSRLSSLLEPLGLAGRIVLEKDIKDFHATTLKNINWDRVNEKLEKMRKESSDWLLSALK